MSFTTLVASTVCFATSVASHFCFATFVVRSAIYGSSVCGLGHASVLSPPVCLVVLVSLSHFLISLSLSQSLPQFSLKCSSCSLFVLRVLVRVLIGA